MRKLAFFRILFLSLIVSFLATSCYDKVEIEILEGTLNVGDHYEFNLTDGEADDVHPHITKIVCILKDSQGNIFKREATIESTKKGDIINFLIGLAEGRYTLLAIEFYTDNPNDKDGVIRIGIGRILEAMNNKIQVKGAYNSKYNFGGSGTKEDPYKINCDTDLYNLQAYINSDGGEKLFVGSYFEQTQDIDLWDYSYYINFEYGWMPIGESYTKPFQGHYDGKGHKITGMFINREYQSALGVFGVLYNAVVQNLNIEEVEILGDGAVGAVAGAVRGDGKQPSVSMIKNCTVSKSKLKGNVGVGGILGLTDVLTYVQIDSCKTAGNNTITTTHYGAGGIVGGGVTNSSLAVTGCHNFAPINGGIANTGGIIGGADTLFVISCYNSGNITASNTDNSVKGVGGIVGGAGICNIIDAHNQGEVVGYKGVGGILGSTIITANEDGSNAVYNNAYIQSSHNTGKITGNMMVGGLCGEAQLAAFESYNAGTVKAEGDYAGGIIGTTSVSAIHITTNFGNITGRKNVGGIAGKVQEGSFAINTNFGDIKATDNWAGGIFGKTGNQSMIHYCGNFGKITLDGSGNIGGIAGEIGDPRKWDGWDIAEVVIGAAEIVVSISCCAAFSKYYSMGGAGEHGLHQTHIAHSVLDAALIVSNAVTNAYAANLLHFPHVKEPSEEASIMKQNITDACENHFGEMEKKFEASLKTVPFKASSLELSDVPMSSLKANRLSLLNFYRKNNTNHELFNDNIAEAMNERYEEVEHDKETAELAHTIVQGVCMAAGVVLFALGFVFTAGVGSAVVMGISTAVSIAGGLNSMTKGILNYEANTLEISQCFNFGEISASSGAHSGGIAGRVADFSLLSNNLNGGTYNKDNTYAIAGYCGGKTTVENNLCINGKEKRDVAKETTAGSCYINDNRVYCSSLDKDSGKYLTKSTINKRDSYSGWDFENMWYLPEDAAAGVYPVPYNSKMTLHKE